MSPMKPQSSGPPTTDRYLAAWDNTWEAREGAQDVLFQRVFDELQNPEASEEELLIQIGNLRARQASLRAEDLHLLEEVARRPNQSPRVRDAVAHLRRGFQERNYLWSEMLEEEQQALRAAPPQRRDDRSEWLAVRLGRVRKEAATREEVQRYVEDQQSKDPTFYALITRFSDPVPILGGRR